MSTLAKNKVSEAIGQVKPFPHIILDAIKLIDSASADSKEISKLIKQDLVLVTRLLSIINSPLYAVNRKIDDIDNACDILGNTIVRNILLLAGTLDSFPLTPERNKIWYHSLEVATVSEYLANKLKQQHGQSYMLGILHDIGKFLLLDTYPEHQSIIQAGRTMGSDSSVEQETDLMGINHAQVGAKVIGVWNFPEEMQQLIENHHNSELAKESGELSILQMADDICHLSGMKLSDDDLLNNLKNDYFDTLNFKRDGLMKFLPEIKTKLLSLVGVFEIIDI